MRIVRSPPPRRRIACDVSALVGPDLGAVDALARLQLLAHRCGFGIELRGARPELRELIELAGLRDVLPSAVEPQG